MSPRRGPTGLARPISPPGSRMVSAAQARFQCRHREKQLHQLGLNVAPRAIGCGKLSIAPRGRADTPLEHHGMPDAVLEEKLLEAFVSSAMPRASCRRRHRSAGRPVPARGHRETTSSPSGIRSCPPYPACVSAFVCQRHHLCAFSQRHPRQKSFMRLAMTVRRLYKRSSFAVWSRRLRTSAFSYNRFLGFLLSDKARRFGGKTGLCAGVDSQ